jgi:hypothetical protein
MEPTEPTTDPPPGGMCGDHTDRIEGLVRECADFLGRIQARAGEFGSRAYLADKAEALRGAAHRLARACHETERWLASCSQEVTCHRGVDPVLYERTLPAGHARPHECVRPDPPLLLLLRVVEELAEAPISLWTELAWMSRDPARIPDCEDLADIGAGLATVEFRLRDACRTAEALRAFVTPGGAA